MVLNMKTFGSIKIFESEALADYRKEQITGKLRLANGIKLGVFILAIASVVMILLSGGEVRVWEYNIYHAMWGVAGLLMLTVFALSNYVEALSIDERAASQVESVTLLERTASQVESVTLLERLTDFKGSPDAEEALREIKRQNRLPRYSEVKAILEAGKGMGLTQAKAAFLGSASQENVSDRT